jgi:hypothetical protein
VIRNRFCHHVFTHKEVKDGRCIYGDRLQSRFLSNKWGYPVWEKIEQDEFDIKNHVKFVPNRIETEVDVLNYMGQLMQEKEVNLPESWLIYETALSGCLSMNLNLSWYT